MPIKPEYKASDFTVGQELWVVSSDRRDQPYFAPVTYIGRSIIKLRDRNFQIKTLTNNSFGNYQAYVNKQDWLNIEESKRLARAMVEKLQPRAYLSETMLTLDQLQRMYAIANEGKEIA